jgi:hypothetical protein
MAPPALTVPQVLQAKLVSKATPAPKATLVLVSKAKQASSDPPVHLVAQLAPLVSKALLAQPVVSKVKLVYKVPPVRQAKLVSKATLVSREAQASKAPRVLSVPQVPQVLQAKLASKVIQEFKAA